MRTRCGTGELLRVRLSGLSIRGAAVLVAAHACAAYAQTTAPVARPPAQQARGAGGDRAPFTQEIEGTTVAFEMTPIPGGAAPDGSTLKPFYLSTTEITWDVYDVWVFSLDVPEGGTDASTRPTKPYLLMDRGFGHQGFPAISMSYKGAQAFCEWISTKTGRKYRVPTEAEWEFACRAGSKTTYFFGEDATPLGEYAWFADNADSKTHEVGSKKPNPWRLHDMLGNASEWVTGRDGAARTAGGCFRDSAKDVTPASRVDPTPAWNASDPQIPKSVWWLADGGFVGLRVVCEDEEPGASKPGTSR